MSTTSMTIQTTINIRTDVRRKIISAAVSSGISVNEMIIRLLTYARKNADIPVIMFSRVQYQPRSDENEWAPQHVSWRVDDYEKFQDMRRLWKMAVSFILAYAIERYLDKCVEDKNEKGSILNVDNNPASYLFISNFNYNNEYFVIFWRYPTQKTLEKFHSLFPSRKGYHH